ncbi:XK-related protein 4-like isoform X2 [Tribolium madens]|uniref:XK-related protein 4-like isoform X2 n=1 Tax=Tribolium madens TaxID=41895 RepID=UPI001CF724B8|nr:XK-related protein 4-like isoform X2 [Tribolium madens]
MVNYDFNKTLSTEKLVHQVDENPVSCFKMLKSLVVSLLLAGNVIYVQYLLFYHDEINWSYPDSAYLTTLVIYFLVAATNTTFSIRIHKMSEYSNDNCNFITKLIVSGVLIAIHVYFSVFMNATLQKSGQNPRSGFDKVVTILVAVVLLFLQITSFLNHVSVAQYAIQCKFATSDFKRKIFYYLMVNAEADADLISTLDCYLRAAPQLIVQCATIVHNQWSFDQIPTLQIFFIFTAFAIMPWSITSFQGSIRKQKRTKMSTKAKIFYFIWHFFVIGSRIASVAAVAAFWPTQTKILTVIHWAVMTTWLLITIKPTQFYNFSNFWHFLFCSVFGAVYFFNPVNLGNQSTRAKYSCFYLIMFVENLVANVGWFVEDSELTLVWKIAFVAFNQFIFGAGIGFMVIYYVKFHPRNSNDSTNEGEFHNETQETAV